MDSLTFLYTVYLISILILIVGVLINIAYILPLQIKQARVKNGLAMLRRLMLAQGFLNLLVGTLLISALTSRFFVHGEEARYIGVTLVLLISLGFLTFTSIWVAMYRQQFTPKQVELHEKIDEIENKTK